MAGGLRLQTAFYAGSTAFAQALTAVVYLVTARWTSPGPYGTLVAAIAVGLVVSSLVDFGLNSLWTREIAAGRGNAPALVSQSGSKLAVLAVAACVGVTGCGLFAPGRVDFAVVAGVSALANSTMQMSLVPYRGLARAGSVAAYTILDRVSAGLLFALLLGTGWGEATTAMWVSLAAGSLLSGSVALRGWAGLGYPWSGFRPCVPWAGSAGFGLSSVAANIQSIDLPLMNAVGGSAVGGVYGAVNRWTQPMNLVSGAISTALIPFAARHGRRKFLSSEGRSVMMLVGLNMAASLVVLVLADPIVRLLLGPEYADSAPVLRLLAAGTMVVTLNQPLLTILQSTGRAWGPSSVLLVGTILQLVGLIPLVDHYGAIGAGFAYLGFQLFVALGLGCLVLRSGRAGR